MKKAIDALAVAVMTACGSPEEAAVSALAGLTVAEAAIEELSSEPPDKFMRIIRRRRSYHNPYVAMRLLDWYDENWMSWPTSYAVAVTAAAVEVCEHLDPSLMALRCRAEKEAANALCDAGHHDAAAEMLRRAETSAEGTTCPKLNLAVVRMVAAKLRLEMRRPLDALTLLAEARALFARSPQPWRVDDCRTMEATAHYRLGEFLRARDIELSMLETARTAGDEQAVAMHLGNVAQCYIMLDNVGAARSCFQTAAVIYEKLDMALFRARMLRGLGRLSIRETGRLREIKEALSEFDRLGRPVEWVLTELAIAEEMAHRGDRLAVLRASQQAYSRAALLGLDVDAASALSHLLESAEQGDATPEFVCEITAQFSAHQVSASCEPIVN